MIVIISCTGLEVNKVAANFMFLGLWHQTCVSFYIVKEISLLMLVIYFLHQGEIGPKYEISVKFKLCIYSKMKNQ